MQAVRFVGVGRPARIEEVPTPSPAAKAAPLSDAALTPYHAIKRALPHLNADSTAVVVGVGGLGHMAIQLLRVLAPVRIVTADVDDKKLQHAKADGTDWDGTRRHDPRGDNGVPAK